MRILLLTHYFAPESGAPQRRWDALIREFEEAGHEVAVLCPPPHHPDGRVPSRFRGKFRPGSAQRRAAGARVFRVAYLPHRGDIVTRTLDHLVAAVASMRRGVSLRRRGLFRPDVVIATAPAIPTLMAGRFLADRFAVPFVAEMRDAWPDLVTHVSGMRGGGAKHWIKAAVHRWVTGLQRAAATVVTTTASFAEVLESRGIEKTAVVRNGAHPFAFEQIPPVKDDHEELRVLYMGTIGRSQGLDVVLRAVHELKRNGVPVDARIIGSGHERGEIEALNTTLGEPVDIRGPVPADQVAEHYTWADTTVVSLRDWEPFAWTVPSKLYELLSAGRHVTGLLEGEGATILRDARGGDVVAPGNATALARLWGELSADRSRLRISESGRRWVRDHVTFSRLGAEYLHVLEGLALDR